MPFIADKFLDRPDNETLTITCGEGYHSNHIEFWHEMGEKS